MKISNLVLAVGLLTLNVAQASEFDGIWLGAKLGNNSSSFTGLDSKNATSFGLEGGYNWDFESYLLGLSGFADYNGRATHNPGLLSYGSRVYGLDAKLGFSMGSWLPYAKLGYAHTMQNNVVNPLSGNSAHIGFGLEYKLMPSLGVSAEFTTASAKNGANKLNNNNFTLGLNYYFDSTPKPVPPAVPFPEPVRAAPVVEAASAPISAPAPEIKPEPKEVWKTLLEEKPVTFDGVNFATDSSQLQGDAKSKLDDVAEFAKLYPDAQLNIAGHTDYRAGKSKKEYNQKLSERRAASFKAALVEKGVAAERISTVGYGFDQPLADNKTEAGRAQNRRVEIRSLIKQEKKVQVKDGE